MKTKKLLILPFIFFSFSHFIFSKPSLPKGHELSEYALSFVEENGLTAKTQNLVTNSSQDFPFNVYVDIPAVETSRENLLFVFNQEDIIENKEFLATFLKAAEKNETEFNITVLFSYGEKQIIKSRDSFSGIEVFLEQLELNEDYAGIYTDLNSGKNRIYEASKGTISSSALIKNCFNSLIKNKLLKSHQFIYTSQQHSFDFINDDKLNLFFEKSIPAIRLNFQAGTEPEKLSSAFQEIISNIDSETFSKWEQHFLLCFLNGSYKLISEKLLLGILIFEIFTVILFLFVFGYINSFIKHQAWKNIKNVWYSVPVTFFIFLISCFAGCKIVPLKNPQSVYESIFLLFSVQYLLSALLLTIYYFFTAAFNHHFLENSIDYLVFISTFINQAIFTFFDISLFPVFLLIFAASFFILFFKKLISHIYLFLLMLFILASYAHFFLTVAEGSVILNFLYNSKLYIIPIALVMTPVSLLYLRIFTKFMTAHQNRKKTLIFAGINFSAIILFFVIISLIRVPQLNRNIEVQKQYSVNDRTEASIKIEYNDRQIFDDIFRTLTIDTGRQVESCTLQIASEKTIPVQYSDYDYQQTSSTKASFKIPFQPPEKLTFSYGTTDEQSIITVSTVYYSDITDEYFRETKTLTIGGNK